MTCIYDNDRLDWQVTTARLINIDRNIYLFFIFVTGSKVLRKYKKEEVVSPPSLSSSLPSSSSATSSTSITSSITSTSGRTKRSRTGVSPLSSASSPYQYYDDDTQPQNQVLSIINN